MKTLLLLRHGKSSWDDESLADHERPLKGRGRRDARRMGRLLLEEDLLPGLIVSSTAVRTRTTAARVAKACRYRRAIELRAELYEAPPDAYVEVLRSLYRDDERVLLVGHNPSLEELIGRLTGRAERFPTAALAHIRLPIDHWSELRPQTRGRLVQLWRPKELD